MIWFLALQTSTTHYSLREVVSTTAETLKDRSIAVADLNHNPCPVVATRQVLNCLADSLERDIPRDDSTGQFLAIIVSKDAVGIVEVKVEPCHYERPAAAFFSGSISSCVENGFVRNAMHPVSSAAARTAGS